MLGEREGSAAEGCRAPFMFHALPRTTFVAWTPARIAL
jgi:hypothetical protein